MRKMILLAMLTGFALCASSSFAAVISVRASGGDYTTVQDAVNNSNAGDEIRIDYTYTDPNTNATNLANDVSLISYDFTGDAPLAGATIDRIHQSTGGTYTVFGVNFRPTAFDGLIISDNVSTMTLDSCNIDTVAGGSGGWGINVWNNFVGLGTTVNVINSTIQNCTAGLISVDSDEAMTLNVTGSTLDTGNVGIFVNVGFDDGVNPDARNDAEDSIINVTDSTITNIAYWAGITCAAPRLQVTVTGSDIINNGERGIFFPFYGDPTSSSDDGVLVVDNSTIQNNGWNGIQFNGNRIDATISNTLIDNNGDLAGDWFNQMGMFSDAQDLNLTMDTVTVSNNFFRGYHCGYWTLRANLDFTNCTFTGNPGQGLGVYANDNAAQPVENVTINLTGSHFDGNGQGFETLTPQMTATIDQSTFNGNGGGVAPSADGMTILATPGTTVLTPMVITNSEFQNNDRGGFYNNGKHNITMTDCTLDGNYEAGMLVNNANTDGGSLSATRCSFDNNCDPAVWAEAAGCFIWTDFPSVFQDCTFNDNGDGGVNNFHRGFRTWDPPANGVHHQFNGCEFNNNSGRGVEFNQQVIADFEGCDFSGNGAQAIFRTGDNGDVNNARLLSVISLDNCTMANNAEEGIQAFGVAVQVNIEDSTIIGTAQTAIALSNNWAYDESQTTKLIADRCTFQSLGTTPGLDTLGLVGTSSTLTNCLITGGRYSVVNGYGTRNDPTTTTVMWDRPAEVLVQFCDILGYDGSNGVLAYGGNNVLTTVNNCIIDGQTTASVEVRGDHITTPSIVLNNNIVGGPYVKAWGNNFSDAPSSGSTALALPVGNVDVDPLFVSTDPVVLNGDYHLQAGSPAIDAAIAPFTSLDIEQLSRDGSPDIGAYEWGAADNTAPDAVLLATNVFIVDNESTHQFTVTYSDPGLIDVATVGTGDVLVTADSWSNGPFSEVATFVSLSAAGNGTPRTATYEINSPNTTWELGDVGTYTVTLQAGEVSDVYGNAVSETVLGTFEVIAPLSAAKGWTLY